MLRVSLTLFSSALAENSSAQCIGPALCLLLFWLPAGTAQAQSVTAASDGTGTSVTQFGNQYTIEAGSLSDDQLNLFHSFDSFSLDSVETANFLTQPSVQNILARISGGGPSVIDGLLQISNQGTSQPNLFLMNPAGILFGPHATLNLPGNLTVTTANGIGFERGAWFSALEPSNYATLRGNPSGDFGFVFSQPGSIVNQGHLGLSPSSTLTLLSGTVVNTGTLSVPGGEITLAAIPGEQIARFSQSGSLLSLDLATLSEGLSHPMASSSSEIAALTPLDLPALLTYSPNLSATSLTTHADGTVSLNRSSGPSMTIPLTSASTLVSGTLDVSNTATPLSVGGDIALLGDFVSIIDADLLGSGTSGGGTFRIGGDYQGQSTLPTATRTFVDTLSMLSADATLQGDGGRIILWADGTTQFNGHISANGGTFGGDGGFVEVSGKDTLFFRGTVEAAAPQGNAGTLLLDPEDITIVATAPAGEDSEVVDGLIDFIDGGASSFTLSENALESIAGDLDIILEATNNITIESLSDGQLNLSAGPNFVAFQADADGDGNGSFIMNNASDTIVTSERPLEISGVNLQIGNINTTPVAGFSTSSPGSVLLQADNQIVVGNITTLADMLSSGLGGDVDIQAGGNITTQDIITEGEISGGDVNIFSSTLPPTTGTISTVGMFGLDGTIAIFPTDSVTSEDPNLDDYTSFFGDDSDYFGDDSDYFGDDSDYFGDDFDYFGDDSDYAEDGSDYFEEESDIEDDSDLEDYDEFDEIGATFDLYDGANEHEVSVESFESERLDDFSEYFGDDAIFLEEIFIQDIPRALLEMETLTNSRTGMVSIRLTDLSTAHNNTKNINRDVGAVELLLVLPGESPTKIVLPSVSAAEVVQTAERFRSTLVTSVRRGDRSYMAPSQQLYQWLIAPIERQLQDKNIDTLIFSMDSGLRTLPIAALHDGENFLVEQFSLGIVPSLNLIDPQYNEGLHGAQVLIMGASDFESMSPLPGVPAEVDIINQQWPGAAFLNNDFTRENLIAQRQQTPYQVIHLATHALFNPGTVEDSFIQLWNDELRLNELAQLGWDSPAVDLLVLSACRTAVDSPEAELGFAGLAIASGVRSVMASLWSVNDLGTLALMNEFYDQLKVSPVKVEALQKAQLAMLHGHSRTEDGQLIDSRGLSFPLPAAFDNDSSSDFSHPYYWSAFTMIGNPW